MSLDDDVERLIRYAAAAVTVPTCALGRAFVSLTLTVWHVLNLTRTRRMGDIPHFLLLLLHTFADRSSREHTPPMVI